MKHFFLIRNPQKEGAETAAEAIRAYIESHGGVCTLGPWHNNQTQGTYRYTSISDVPEETQCVLTLGGDGTLIQAARDLVGSGLPFMGINLGTLGYLTQVSGRDPLDPVLDALLAGECQLENRMMVAGTVMSGGRPVMENLALNEIVITRKDTLRVLKFEVYLNGVFFNEYTADGVIIATPTGSTAYNLSAGGPIAAPGAKLLILTPICSHSLNTRSIVLSPEDQISIRMTGSRQQRHTVVFDGDAMAELAYGDTVEISRSDCYTKLVKLKEVSFLDNLRNKMVRI